MAGDNRTPDKIIGEIKYAQDESARAKEEKKSERPSPHHETEDVRANPDLDPAKKKTGEF
jgi:hypothetical protein